MSTLPFSQCSCDWCGYITRERRLSEYNWSMGCCYSCKDDGSNQGGEANERTHLLVDPVSNSTAIQRVHSEDFISRPDSLPKKTDEQSALNQILQETATNVIDVAALDSHVLEQHEYHERVKHYAQKLQAGSRWTTPRRLPSLLMDVPAPEKLLAAELPSPTNFEMIVFVVSQANEALLNLKVQHEEDLVVPFRIP